MEDAKGNFLTRGLDEVDFLEENEIDKDVQCGIWFCKGPKCQILASKKSTFLVFSVVAMFCGASYAYNTGIITTMEKQYKFSNKKIGVIIGFSEITSILGSFLVPYYASARGNFPKWMAIGVLLYALSFVLNGLPYFIYGSGRDALSNTIEYGSIFSINNTVDEKWNAQFKDMCMANRTHNENCDKQYNEYPGVAVILSLSALVLGSAEAFIIPLAISYLDNNVKKSKMPMMLTLTSFIRMLAPLVGFSLASICLKIYVDPTLHTTITNDDPRWIGAWWIGWFILALVLVLAAPIVASFPKVLPRQALRNKEQLLKREKNGEVIDENGTTSLKDFLVTLKRLFTNKVLICNNVAAVFYVFGYIPYFKYQAKYIEVQYLFSASKANMITGTASLIFTAFGFLVGGTVIQKTRPSARKLAGWNVIASIISICGILGWAMFGCDNNNNMETLKISSMESSCNSNCNCDYVKYMPVCGSNVTYISPCHAGCNEKATFGNDSYIYSNCQCVSPNTYIVDSNITTIGGTYTESPLSILEKISQNGPCPVDCMKAFYIFLTIMCFTKFIKGTEGMANFLLGIRCVEPKDKPISLGLSGAMFSLFSFLPSPIFFGWIIDRTCILWGKTCGQDGNCWLYDTVSMRLNLNLTAAGFIFIGTLFDIGTFYYSKNVKIFDDDEENTKEKEMTPMNNQGN